MLKNPSVFVFGALEGTGSVHATVVIPGFAAWGIECPRYADDSREAFYLLAGENEEARIPDDLVDVLCGIRDNIDPYGSIDLALLQALGLQEFDVYGEHDHAEWAATSELPLRFEVGTGLEKIFGGVSAAVDYEAWAEDIAHRGSFVDLSLPGGPSLAQKVLAGVQKSVSPTTEPVSEPTAKQTATGPVVVRLGEGGWYIEGQGKTWPTPAEAIEAAAQLPGRHIAFVPKAMSKEVYGLLVEMRGEGRLNGRFFDVRKV